MISGRGISSSLNPPHSVLSLLALHYQTLLISRCTIPLPFAPAPINLFSPLPPLLDYKLGSIANLISSWFIASAFIFRSCTVSPY